MKRFVLVVGGAPHPVGVAGLGGTCSCGELKHAAADGDDGDGEGVDAAAQLAVDVDAPRGDGVPAAGGAELVAHVGPDLGFDPAIVVHVQSRSERGGRGGLVGNEDVDQECAGLAQTSAIFLCCVSVAARIVDTRVVGSETVAANTDLRGG